MVWIALGAADIPLPPNPSKAFQGGPVMAQLQVQFPVNRQCLTATGFNTILSHVPSCFSQSVFHEGLL